MQGGTGMRRGRRGGRRRTLLRLLWPWLWALLLVLPAPASALAPAVEFDLRDGPVPDGVADDLIPPSDTANYGRVFQNDLFDAEFHVQFPVTGAATGPDVMLVLRVTATGTDLQLGESKTFELSSYTGEGVASLDAFGLGTGLDTIVLPANGEWELDVDVTARWNDAVQAGDGFLGIRIHDPVWTGTLEGAGTITYGSAELLPEPAAPALIAAALLALGVLARRAGAPLRAGGGQPGSVEDLPEALEDAG